MKIGQNTEKSLWDLRRLTITHIPVRNNQLTLVWKTFKGLNYNNGIWRGQLYQLWLVLLAFKEPGRFGSWRPSGYHPNNSIIENAQNTEKSPGDLKRLAVTQSQVKDNQLTQMLKTLMSKNYNNKTRHDWVGKVIHWEMCKKFKFDHTNK